MRWPSSHDIVVVEGAGGLLVRLDSDGGTLLDLAAELASRCRVEVVVVCAAGLGTLNHAELTVMALRARGLEPAGLIIGSWPRDPGPRRDVQPRGPAARHRRTRARRDPGGRRIAGP